MIRYLTFLFLICLACKGPNSGESHSVPEDPEVVTDSPSVSQESQRTEVNDVEFLVYVTHDGDKYHTADCRYSKGADQISLKQAKANGKTACGICKPNSKTGEKQIRCSGITSEGKQCQRMTTDKSGKCFQHRED